MPQHLCLFSPGNSYLYSRYIRSAARTNLEKLCLQKLLNFSVDFLTDTPLLHSHKHTCGYLSSNATRTKRLVDEFIFGDQSYDVFVCLQVAIISRMEDSPSHQDETGHQSTKIEDDPMYSFSPESSAKVEGSEPACRKKRLLAGGLQYGW